MSLEELLQKIQPPVPQPSLPLAELMEYIYTHALTEVEIDELFTGIKNKWGFRPTALRNEWLRYRKLRLEEEGRRTQPPAPPSPEAVEAAEKLSMDDALLHRAIQAIRKQGLVGEDENAGLLYLALLSAKTPTPISVFVKGRSSSGKSHLVSSVLKMIPPRGYYELSSMSAKALAYMPEELSHRHLIVFEEEGFASDDARHLIRVLLSEGRLRHSTVMKTAGGELRGTLLERNGPTGLITTMTQGTTREDNETRAFSLYVQDTTEHTLRVLEASDERENPDRDIAPFDPAPWHALYELLPQMDVKIPFAEHIRKLLRLDRLGADSTRLRRDYPRFKSLVKMITLLHHARRENHRGTLLATLEDYALAHCLAARTLSRSVHSISPRALALARAVVAVREQKRQQQRGGDEPLVFTRDLSAHLRWELRTVQRWVDQAEAAGLIESRREGRALILRPAAGVEASLEEAAFQLLPDPGDLARALGASVEYVDPITGWTWRLPASGERQFTGAVIYP